MKKLDKLQIEEIGGDARGARLLDETLRGWTCSSRAWMLASCPIFAGRSTRRGQTLKSAEVTLKERGEGPCLRLAAQADLRQTLRELNRTLTAVRALAELLQQHPESLIRGKPAPASP